MSETPIEELERRAAMLITSGHPCVNRGDGNAVYIDLGPYTGIEVWPSHGRLRVLHQGDAYYRLEEVVSIHEPDKVEEVVKILRLRTVLEELGDV